MATIVYSDAAPTLFASVSPAFELDPEDPFRILIFDTFPLPVREVGVLEYVVADGLLTDAVLRDPEGVAVVTFSDGDIPVETLLAAIIGVLGDLNAYGAVMAILAGDDTISGGAGNDFQLETGKGNDTVFGGPGNDIIRKWDTGDLIADGGEGEDTLSFSAMMGIQFPVEPIQGAIVDLTGTMPGRTPYGGSLTVTGIEHIEGSPLSDVLIGDDNDNRLGDDHEFNVYGGGTDTIHGGGGDDLIYASIDAVGGHFDGGPGIDTLFIGMPSDFFFDSVTVDLTDPTNNTGTMAGATIIDIEIIRPTVVFAGAAIFHFRGDENDNIAYASSGPSTLQGMGGDDTLIGGSGANVLIGGEGNDTLDAGFVPLGQANFLLGGPGDDTYLVRNDSDVVDEGFLFAEHAALPGDFDTIVSHAEFWWDFYHVGQKHVIADENFYPLSAMIGSLFGSEMVGNQRDNIIFTVGGDNIVRPRDGVDWIALGVTDGHRGVDTLVLEKPSGIQPSWAIVWDFMPGEDKVDMTGLEIDSFAAIQAAGQNDGAGNSYYLLDGGANILFLVGLEMADVSAGDFIV